MTVKTCLWCNNDATEEFTRFCSHECWRIYERETCGYCRDEREAQGRPAREAYERHSFGAYAGRYCDQCWPQSGYRDATDPSAEFSELDAGERLEPDEDYTGIEWL